MTTSEMEKNEAACIHFLNKAASVETLAENHGMEVIFDHIHVAEDGQVVCDFTLCSRNPVSYCPDRNGNCTKIEKRKQMFFYRDVTLPQLRHIVSAMRDICNGPRYLKFTGRILSN